MLVVYRVIIVWKHDKESLNLAKPLGPGRVNGHGVVAPLLVNAGADNRIKGTGAPGFAGKASCP